MPTVIEALAAAVEHHQAGRLQEAEAIYRQILQADPNQADAIHLLGVLACQVGRPDVAATCIQRAIQLNGNESAYHYNLGNAYLALGDVDGAIASLRRTLELKPDHPEALSNLGNSLQRQGKLDEAIACYLQALALRPSYAEANYNLATALLAQDKIHDAAEYLRQAVQWKPDYFEAHNNLGNALERQGKLHEAIVCYRRASELQPNFVDAHNNLGNALLVQGRTDEAIASCRRALDLKPDNPDAYNNLGNALQRQGKLDEAMSCYHRAVELKPDHVGAHNNLGNAYLAQDKLADAAACYQRALEIQPAFADLHSNLGNVLQRQGRLDEAIGYCRRALELEPNHADAYNNLGNAYQEQQKLDDAIACYHRALAIRPELTLAHYNLGNALQAQGNLDQAIASYGRALELNPDFIDAHYNLGNALLAADDLDRAAGSYRRALELRPDFAIAHTNLGNALKAQGDLAGAVACFRQALDLQPFYADAHSNLIFSLYYSAEHHPWQIEEEQARWNATHAEPLSRFAQPHGNQPSADRRLRVGYVSGDFRNHVVGLFLLPLLEAMDREHFETFCYSSVRVHDQVTDRFRAQTHSWRDVQNLSNEQLASVIRDDQIDILVDLAMHAADNRLLLFARKPAPVQVTYLACVGTTGLSAMDYRLTDPYLDPPNQVQSNSGEQPIWLPETYWCYRPLVSTPPVGELPAWQSGQITFGCLNNFCKVTDPALATWASLLQAVPQARLLLHACSGNHRDRVREFFAQRGIAADRLAFVGRLPIQDYYRTHQQIDIALDPFPYGGGTTTCDALWMGVPVVTLVGQTQVGRAGLSILSNVGCAQWAARDREEYVRIALELASDLPRLSDHRAQLRERMQHSPLMDAPRFARHIEAAYREMWRRWCKKQT